MKLVVIKLKEDLHDLLSVSGSIMTEVTTTSDVS
jgi:hypothetical protein